MGIWGKLWGYSYFFVALFKDPVVAFLFWPVLTVPWKLQERSGGPYSALASGMDMYVGVFYVRSGFTCKVVAAMVYSLAYYVGGFYVRSEFSYKAAPA